MSFPRKRESMLCLDSRLKHSGMTSKKACHCEKSTSSDNKIILVPSLLFFNFENPTAENQLTL